MVGPRPSVPAPRHPTLRCSTTSRGSGTRGTTPRGNALGLHEGTTTSADESCRVGRSRDARGRHALFHGDRPRTLGLGSAAENLRRQSSEFAEALVERDQFKVCGYGECCPIGGLPELWGRRGIPAWTLAVGPAAPPAPPDPRHRTGCQTSADSKEATVTGVASVQPAIGMRPPRREDAEG